jgi:hypothetical protein
MLTRAIGIVVALGLVLTGGSCGGGDGDFEGSWMRVGLLDSTISLRRDENQFHFRWKLSDGVKTIECPRDDYCEEFRDGDRVYEYQFRLEHDPARGEITVRCEGRPLVAEMEPVSWVDRLVVRERGRELWAFLLEMNGEDMKQPIGPIRFVRISDTPF